MNRDESHQDPGPETLMRLNPSLLGVVADCLVARHPEFLLPGLLFVSLANYGFLSMGSRVRLTELCVGLMLAVYGLRSRAGLEKTARPRASLERRAQAGFWVLTGAYTIAAILCAWGRGAGGVRFEIEALLVFLLALQWGKRLTAERLAAVVAAAVAVSCVAALALAAHGVRGVWFFAPGAPCRVISFAEGDPASSGVFQLGGLFGHKNFLAAFLVLSLPVLLGGATDGAISRRWRPWLAGSLALGVGVLILTDALFGMAVAALSLGIVVAAGLSRFAEPGPDMGRIGHIGPMGPIDRPSHPPARSPLTTHHSPPTTHRSPLTHALLSLAPLALLVLVAAGIVLSGRISALLGKGGSGSLNARAYLWKEGWRLVAEHLWTGIGREAFGEQVDGGFPHAHNLCLMKYVESGVIGGTLFACLILTCVAAAIRALRSTRSRVLLGFSAGFIGFVIYSLTDYFYNEPPLMALFWLWAGLAVGPRERTNP